MKLLNYTTPTIEVISMDQADVICASQEYGIDWSWGNWREGGIEE